jgi:hypothetical protein
MQLSLTPVEYEFLRRRVARRLQRVRERMEAGDEPDDILDDFFVLWRAFESTADLVDTAGTMQQLPPDRPMIERISKAVDITIKHRRGIRGIQRLRNFAVQFPKLVSAIKDTSLEGWFRGDPEGSPAKKCQELRTRCDSIRFGATNWQRNHSRDLSKILYLLRNSVFHGGFSTSVDNAPEHLSLLRDAMVDLVEARLAWMESCRPMAIRYES